MVDEYYEMSCDNCSDRGECGDFDHYSICDNWKESRDCDKCRVKGKADECKDNDPCDSFWAKVEPDMRRAYRPLIVRDNYDALAIEAAHRGRTLSDTLSQLIREGICGRTKAMVEAGKRFDNPRLYDGSHESGYYLHERAIELLAQEQGISIYEARTQSANDPDETLKEFNRLFSGKNAPEATQQHV